MGGGSHGCRRLFIENTRTFYTRSPQESKNFSAFFFFILALVRRDIKYNGIRYRYISRCKREGILWKIKNSLNLVLVFREKEKLFMHCSGIKIRFFLNARFNLVSSFFFFFFFTIFPWNDYAYYIQKKIKKAPLCWQLDKNNK